MAALLHTPRKLPAVLADPSPCLLLGEVGPGQLGPSQPGHTAARSPRSLPLLSAVLFLPVKKSTAFFWRRETQSEARLHMSQERALSGFDDTLHGM